MSDWNQGVANTLSALKLTDIVAYDFRRYSPLFDTVFVATASSERQVHASIRHMMDAFQGKTPRFSVEGAQESRWILFDLGDVLVNVMHKEERDYYGLDKLFVERPRLKLDL